MLVYVKITNLKLKEVQQWRENIDRFKFKIEIQNETRSFDIINVQINEN